MRNLSFAICVVVSIAGPAAPSTVAGETVGDRFSHWPVDLTITGKVVIGDAIDDPALLERALSDKDRDGRVSLLVDEDTGPDPLVRYAALFSASPDYRVVKRESKDAFQRLPELLGDCQTFLWHSTRMLDEDELAALRAHRETINSFLSGGGTFVGIGPAATLVGAFARTGKPGVAETNAGLGIVPDCQIELGESESIRGQMLARLAERPRTVGIVLARGSLLQLSGRIFSLTGSGSATWLVADGNGFPPSQTIKERQSRRQSGNDYLIDLTQWRRRAIDSTLEPFPPNEPEPPMVAGGKLVIVGGGRLPDGLMERFVELAGGPEAAKLVYVPCSQADRIEGMPGIVSSWKRMGVRKATFIHTKDRNQAHRDEKFLEPLKQATGIWFGGGRQWNFADSYYGTRAQELMQAVVKRGGVVGGSSAGASVQARFLARATPIENTRILAPGYQRGGLGFISGVAIDQHFSQRNRQPDLSRLVKRYPQMLGIGIDESTAIVVSGSRAEIIGEGDVYFYDQPQTGSSPAGDFTKVSVGGSYDLVDRNIIATNSPLETSSLEASRETTLESAGQ